MANRFLPIFLLAVVVCVHSGVIKRNKRGFLARQGVCPKPSTNPKVADVRLNYLGNPVVFEKKDCTRSECTADSNCDGDQKCCRNRCGARVCTDAVRDDHPCLNVRCPEGEMCKVRHVKCVMPLCYSGDVLALGEPTCIPDPNAPKRPIKTYKDIHRRPASARAPALLQDQMQAQQSLYQTPTYATTYPGCTQPPCDTAAQGMYPTDQSQAAPFLPEQPPQEFQQPQQVIQQPQPQQFLPQPQPQQPEQEAESEPAPLQDLDSPNNNQQQVQPMYPAMAQPVVQQQYMPQAQWSKKH